MQTTVSQYGAPSFVGMLDGIGPKSGRSYAAEEIIPIGYPVALGINTPDQTVIKAVTGALAVGFALHDHAREQPTAGVVQYAETETVSVLTAGRMWVATSGLVVAGAIANLTVADGTLTDEPVAAGIEAFTQIQVTFLTGTASAGLALVEIK